MRTLHRISFTLQIVFKSPKFGAYWLGSVEHSSLQNPVFVEFLLDEDCHLQRQDQGSAPNPSRVGVGDGSLEAREVFGRHAVLDVHRNGHS